MLVLSPRGIRRKFEQELKKREEVEANAAKLALKQRREHIQRHEPHMRHRSAAAGVSDAPAPRPWRQEPQDKTPAHLRLMPCAKFHKKENGSAPSEVKEVHPVSPAATRQSPLGHNNSNNLHHYRRHQQHPQTHHQNPTC